MLNKPNCTITTRRRVSVGGARPLRVILTDAPARYEVNRPEVVLPDGEVIQLTVHVGIDTDLDEEDLVEITSMGRALAVQGRTKWTVRQIMPSPGNCAAMGAYLSGKGVQ